MTADPAIQFPGGSGEYRLARNRLLEAEIELRRMIERIAAQRRTLPPGGAVPGDYVFEAAADGGGAVKFSPSFEPGKDKFVIYSFMFPRWSGDTRPGPAASETVRLPLAETPCPSRTSILDSLDGAPPRPPHQPRRGREVRPGPDPHLRPGTRSATCSCCLPGTTTTTATITQKGRTVGRPPS